MSDSRYQGDGFTQDSNNVIFADASSDLGSTSDYDTWDWKQIQAAILGMSNGTATPTNADHMAAIASPATLATAAESFYRAQLTFQMVAKSLTDQANALAGPDGPWAGDAADSFFDMMNTFSKQVQANADVLSGGNTGTNSVPEQLALNSTSLTIAQNLINQINTWYAQQAINMGVQKGKNGLIPVGNSPEVVEMMTADMRSVLKSLASNYQTTIDSIRAPTSINSSPTNAQPDIPLSPTPSPSGDLSTADSPLAGGATPFAGGTTPSTNPRAFPVSTGTGGGDTGVPPFDPKALETAINPGEEAAPPSPFPGGFDTTVPGGGKPQAFTTVPTTPFPGSTDLPTTLPPSTGVPNPALGNDGSDFDNTSPVLGFPGSTNTGTTTDTGPKVFTTVPTTAAFPGSTDLPTGVPNAALANDGSAFGETPPVQDFPGEKGIGVNDGSAGVGTPDITGTPASFPNSLGLESRGPQSDFSLPGATASPTAFPATSELAAGQAGSGMPFMPPGSMGAPGGASQGATDPSDSSGLLDSSTTPWTGTTDTGFDEPHALTTTPENTGLDLPTSPEAFPAASELAASQAGSGMPFMPPGSMGAPGGASQGATDPSDSSGLLDSSTTPWTGTTDTGFDEPHALTTTPENTGLDLPTSAEAFPAASELAASQAGSGMPFMPPGSMGAPGGASQGATDPSDSSGLLDSSTTPWTGTTDTGFDEPHALTTTPENTGLDLPTSTHAPSEGVLPGEVAVALPGGMPFMPPGSMSAPGTEQGSTSRQPDSGDAAALLDADTDPWGAEPEVAEADALIEGTESAVSSGRELSPPAEFSGLTAEAPAGSATAEPAASLLPDTASSGLGLDEQPAQAAHLLAIDQGGGPVAESASGDHTREAALVAEAALLTAAALASRKVGQRNAEEETVLADPVPAVAAAEEDISVDFAAWDSSEDSIVSLLWAADTVEDDEGEGPTSHYSREEAETWTGADAAPAWSTWQPNRQGAADSGSVSFEELALSDNLQCTDVPYEPEAEPVEDAAEEEIEEAPVTRNIADLLVQTQTVWGTSGHPEDALS